MVYLFSEMSCSGQRQSLPHRSQVRGYCGEPPLESRRDMSTEVFYRFHQNAAPCFCADHAWSAPWGSAFTPDGSQYECPSCDGTGDNHIDPACRHCDGTGEDTTTCYHCDGTSYDDDDMCSECGGTGHTTTKIGRASCRERVKIS